VTTKLKKKSIIHSEVFTIVFSRAACKVDGNNNVVFVGHVRPTKEEIMIGERKNMLLVTLAVFAIITILLSSTPLVAQDGATLFKSKCAMCHGPDGKGDTFMGKKLSVRDLSSPDVQKQTDAELNAIITKGKDKMPAFGGKLSAEQINQLVAHIRELGKKK
jgi:cytochrome c6